MLRNASFRIPELGSRRGNGRRVASSARHREASAEADGRSGEVGGKGGEILDGEENLGGMSIRDFLLQTYIFYDIIKKIVFSS
jgi:hypothetical protein